MNYQPRELGSRGFLLANFLYKYPFKTYSLPYKF